MSTPSFGKKKRPILSGFGSGLRRAISSIFPPIKKKSRKDSQSRGTEPPSPLLGAAPMKHFIYQNSKSGFVERPVEEGAPSENAETNSELSLKPANLIDIRHIVEEVLNNEQQLRNLMETKGEDAQLWLDALQALSELPGIMNNLRSSILNIMLHLSRESGLCPQCLIIGNVKKLGDYPVGGGGFGDVWKGVIGNQIVCLKVVRVYLASDVRRSLTQYMREAIVWKQLKHPNLLPFMGMYFLDRARTQLCLVSPWMERGNLVQYLKETPMDQVDHYSLVFDVALGLAYLHSREFAHGDLKGFNILITPDERACIGDFGLSQISNADGLESKSTSSAESSKGATRWLAPELFELNSCPSLSSDMYSFACVCYEIFSGHVPFFEVAYDSQVIFAVATGRRPLRPRSTLLIDQLWNIMEDCWSKDPQLRPNASQVLEQMAGLDNLDMRIWPAPDWDFSILTQVGKDVKYPHLDIAALTQLQEKLKSPIIIKLDEIKSPVIVHTFDPDMQSEDISISQLVEDVLKDEWQSKNLLETKGEAAQAWLDVLQVVAKLPDVSEKLRATTLKAMVRLSERSGLVPRCLIIGNVKLSSDIPVGEGAFGDVWKGEIGPQTVCLKITRVYRNSNVQKLLKVYIREAIVWQQTTHPNVLPFMGMYYLDKTHRKICLVSPWMKEGNLHDYLQNKSVEQVDHYTLVYDVASGLSYLHEKNIVHGDLKGVNVLITPEERACIGDFGLSRVADTYAQGFTSSKKTHISGTLRWLSPEILDSDPPCPTSKSSDMYAFAGVCYEIFTGEVPFHEKNDGAVVVAVIIHKHHPSRPALTSLSNTMWNIMVDCWKAEPAQRPAAFKVLARVAEFNSLKTNSRISPASDWDGFNRIQILRNIEHRPFDIERLVQLQKDLKSPNIAFTSPTATFPLPEIPAAHCQ